MAKNIKQVYDANPSTTLTTDDLMYLGKSPYGATNDSAIKVQDIFTSSPVIDKSVPRYNNISGYKIQSSTMIINDNGSLIATLSGGINIGGTVSSHTIASFQGNYSSGSVTGSYGNIAVQNDANKNEAALFGAYTTTAGSLNQAWLSMGLRNAGTDNILMIMSPDTGVAFNTGDLYASAYYISNDPFDSLITNTTKFMGFQLAGNMAQNTFINLYDPGSANGVVPIFTTATTHGVMAQTADGLGSIVNSSLWNTTVSSSATTQNMVVGGFYGATNSALVIYNLPATALAGEVVEIADAGTGRVKIGQAAGQFIQFGNLVTTTGTSGSLTSTAKGDCITIRNIVANNQWQVVSVIGNWTIV